MPRERDAVPRGFFAALERGEDERLVPVLADFARAAAGVFSALLLRAVLFRAVLLRVVDFARVEVLRVAAERLVVVPRDDEAADEPSSITHLPDSTRCAASATASAINVPSLVALATTLLAACEAVSAASRPASRIAFRALGLALIAAAAAASPAASISLLIAALASLSTVSLPEEEPEELLAEDLACADLAIASSPSVRKRHFKGCNGSRMMAEEQQNLDMLKGTVTVWRRCPSTWSAAEGVAVRQLVRAYEHPFPTSLLNHETSDHLLSLR